MLHLQADYDLNCSPIMWIFTNNISYFDSLLELSSLICIEIRTLSLSKVQLPFWCFGNVYWAHLYLMKLVAFMRNFRRHTPTHVHTCAHTRSLCKQHIRLVYLENLDAIYCWNFITLCKQRHVSIGCHPRTAEARRCEGKGARGQREGAHARIILEERVNNPLSFW